MTEDEIQRKLENVEIAINTVYRTIEQAKDILRPGYVAWLEDRMEKLESSVNAYRDAEQKLTTDFHKRIMSLEKEMKEWKNKYQK